MPRIRGDTLQKPARARRVRHDHNRHGLSPLPGSDETKRQDSFARSRRGLDLFDDRPTGGFVLRSCGSTIGAIPAH